MVTDGRTRARGMRMCHTILFVAITNNTKTMRETLLDVINKNYSYRLHIITVLNKLQFSYHNYCAVIMSDVRGICARASVQ